MAASSRYEIRFDEFQNNGFKRFDVYNNILIFIPEFILSFLSLEARIKYIIDLITVSIIVNRNKIEIQLFLLFWNHE